MRVIDRTSHDLLCYKFEVWVDKGAMDGESNKALGTELANTIGETLSFFKHVVSS